MTLSSDSYQSLPDRQALSSSSSFPQFIPCHAIFLSSFFRLCGGLDLGESLALLESSLLLEAEDLESLEIGQGAALVLDGTGLGPAGGLPLGVDLGLLPELLDGTSAGGTGQLLNDERCEENVGEGQRLSGDNELLVR